MKKKSFEIGHIYGHSPCTVLGSSRRRIGKGERGEAERGVGEGER